MNMQVDMQVDMHLPMQHGRTDGHTNVEVHAAILHLTAERAPAYRDSFSSAFVSGSLAASRSDNTRRLATDTPKPPLRQHTTSTKENQ